MRLGLLAARAAPFKGELAVISLLTIGSSVALLALPWLAAQLLGGMVTGEKVTALSTGQVLSLLLAVLGAMTLLNIAAAVASARTSGRILERLRSDCHDHIIRLPVGFHDRSRQGDLLALMSYEVASLSTFLTSTLATVPAMLLTAIGALVLLFLLDPALALVVPLAVPVFFIVLKLVGRRLRALSAQVRKAEVDVVVAAETDLDMLPAIKSFAVEGGRQDVFDAKAAQARVMTFAQARMQAITGPVLALIVALAAVAIIVLAGEQVQAGGRNPAELFAFLLYAALLTRPVGALADIYGKLQIARGTLARLEAVLRVEPERGYAATQVPQDDVLAISFKNVGFAYSGRPLVLDGLSLDIAAGETVALTGANGTGKSTLIHLLLRFYEPQQGRICVGGQDIAALDVQGLRRLIGFVPQRGLMLSGSVRENITFGAPDASEAQIAAACALAQADGFIAALPRGFDTMIGDHGVRLSGGQRQRLALARALVCDPPVLVFDEATSMYDTQGEADFIAACRSALAGRTVLIVTHRPASLALADRVLELSDGKVAEVTAPS